MKSGNPSVVRATDIEEWGAMQKEKQCFEGIPNCGKKVARSRKARLR